MDLQKKALWDRLFSCIEKRRKNFEIIPVTPTKSLLVDFKARLHLYLMPTVDITFTCEDMGTIFVPGGQWTEIYFPEGTKLTPSASNTIFTLATDEPLQNTWLVGQAAMAASVPVTLASDQSAISTRGDMVQYVGSASALNADLLPATDVSLYKWISFQINTSVYSGTLTFQCSNDGVTWNSCYFASIGSTNTGTTTTASTIMFHGPVSFKWLRIRMTSYASGTAECTVSFFYMSTSMATVGIGSNGSSIGVYASLSGGCSQYHRISTADTNAVNIRSTSGQIYGWSISNTNAAWRFVKLHNTGGTPTAGAGVVRAIGIPPQGVAIYNSAMGIYFSNGIGLTAVTGIADADATAIGAGDLSIDIEYR